MQGDTRKLKPDGIRRQSVCTPADSDEVGALLSRVKALEQRLVSEKVRDLTKP